MRASLQATGYFDMKSFSTDSGTGVALSIRFSIFTKSVSRLNEQRAMILFLGGDAFFFVSVGKVVGLL